MPDWDENSPQLQRNLADILTRISRSAPLRERPTVESARQWHVELLRGLSVPDETYRGAFRGEPGLEGLGVRIGSHTGVSAQNVSLHLSVFERRLHDLLSLLDAVIRRASSLNADQLAAVLDLCAWTHAEWVRIHPFANGNGRVARLWANSLAIRYGVPPFVPLRPRPGADYGQAGLAAMEGHWQPTAAVVRRLYLEAIGKP